jgi:hypothetical protein
MARDASVTLSVAIAIAVGALVACGESSSGIPTAPTPASTTPANIGGSYNLSIGAASTCSVNLPVDTRVLHYVADIAQTGAAFSAQLTADVTWNNAVVTGTVSGQTLTFSTFSFSENTTGGGVALATTGTASVAGDGLITGTLSGTYQTPSGSSCNAGNHQLYLGKR